MVSTSFVIMFEFNIWLFVLYLAADVAQSCDVKKPEVPDGFILHNVVATWAHAHAQCQSEGAILASPIDDKSLNIMKSLISVYNTTFYIGTKMSYSDQFVSIEGVPFENMTVAQWQQLVPLNGDCLAMTCDSIRAVPCWDRLPYMCVQPPVLNMNKTNCGPIENGYKYDLSTHRCYKVHTDKLSWDRAHWTCVADGGYLAVVDNDIEAHRLQTMVDSSWSYIWIGLRDSTGKGNWISVHGKPVEDLYNVWENDNKPGNIEILCGAFFPTGKLLYGRCTYSLNFICEKEPTEEVHHYV